MRIYLTGFLAVALPSCLYMRKPPDVISSPSKNYILQVDLNKDKDDKTKYDCVLLTLFDSSDNKISTLQTGASNNMKWAVDWYPKKDTIVLYSIDIGNRAYHLTDKNQLDTIAVTRDIDSIAKIIFQKKYASR